MNASQLAQAAYEAAISKTLSAEARQAYATIARLAAGFPQPDRRPAR